MPEILDTFQHECTILDCSRKPEGIADSKSVTGESKLGICLDYMPEQRDFTYFIGVENISETIPGGLTEEEMPAATWAIFESVGPMPDAIQNLSKRIYSEWFPTTAYERAGEFDMEVYNPGDPDSDDYRCEVWIPVVRT